MNESSRFQPESLVKGYDCGEKDRVFFGPRYASVTTVAAEATHIDGVPTQLGDFRLIGKIGEGGMGAVYEGIQQKLDRRVAVKVLAPRLAQDEVFLGRFKREAKAAASISHSGLIQVFDSGEEGGVHFYAMEFIHGEDLGRRLKREERIPLPDAMAVVTRVAESLKAALAQNVIHRDIKPENIMITDRGEVKLADLGLAKILEGETGVTLTGTGMGSPHFMAPEQAEDAGHVDHRADIYSLGITLLTLVTGKRPFDSTSPYTLARAHAEKPLPASADLGLELPREIEDLIHRMAAKNLDERFCDYDALLSELRRLQPDGIAEISAGKVDARVQALYQGMVAGEAEDVSSRAATQDDSLSNNFSGFSSLTAVPANQRKGSEGFRLGTYGIVGVVLIALVYMALDFVRDAQQSAVVIPAKPGSTNVAVVLSNSPPAPQPELSGVTSTRGTVEDIKAMEFLLGVDSRESGGKLGRAPVPMAVVGLLIPGRERADRHYILPTGSPPKLLMRGIISDTPAEKLFLRALELAQANTNELRGLVMQFTLAYANAGNPTLRGEILPHLSKWANRMDEAARREIDRFSLEMILLLEEGKNAAAVNVWREFPKGLNVFRYEPMIYDLIRTNVPREFLPPGFGMETGPDPRRLRFKVPAR